MITKEQVIKVFDKWEFSGLTPPVNRDKKENELVEEFLERFSLMDEAALSFVANRIAGSSAWPTFGVIEQLAKDYEASHKDYVTIDYYKQLTQSAYGENESFEQFVERVAEKCFPGKGQAWRERFAFQLHFYGVCVHACENCQGVCPHNGHRYKLRIKKGSCVPVPWASLELCEKYKQSIDREGHKRKRPAEVSSDEEVLGVVNLAADIEPPQEAFNVYSHEIAYVPKAKSKPKQAEVTTLEGFEVTDNG